MQELTPLKSVRKRCLDCAGSAKEVSRCQENCLLAEYKFGKRPRGKANLTPVRAIRKYCLWCVLDQPTEARLCPVLDCPMYPYRLGKNPHRTGKGGNPAWKKGVSIAKTGS